MLDSTASDNGWKLGQKVPITFAQTGTQQFTVESIYTQSGFTNYVITIDAYEKNFTRPARLPGVREHEGWRHARRTPPRSRR